MKQELREFEASRLKKEIQDFRPGDTISVAVRIKEGDKERLQKFEGVCIRRRGGGMRQTFTVRRVSYGVGMERIFPLHSPLIESINIIRRGKVRRARLYYQRELRGKKARIVEKKTEYKKPVQNLKAEVEQEEVAQNEQPQISESPT